MIIERYAILLKNLRKYVKSFLKIISFNDVTKETIKQHNLDWLHIPDQPCKILIISGSGSGKTNALLELVNDQADIDKICLYAKDPCEAKYQFLIDKREKAGLKLDSHLPKKKFLFASMIALKNDEKWFLFHLKRSFDSQDT